MSYLIGPEMPGVVSTANCLDVFTRRRDLARTTAPIAYESFVASVTHACVPSETKFM